jgi:hypothetical protein
VSNGRLALDLVEFLRGMGWEREHGARAIWGWHSDPKGARA